ncbi:MAG: chemotaxis protein CheW [Deltaproteobacteria bacterium]|nr:chemotaxis protein CheW [Deltaproteobacteria bacterium]
MPPESTLALLDPKGLLTGLEAAPDARRWLGFVLDGAHYALPLDLVREVLPLAPLTEVPRAPERVLGVALLHGEVTTVCDPRRALGLPPAPWESPGRLLLVAFGGETLALRVDQVTRIHALKDREIERAEHMSVDVGRCVAGIARPRIREGAGAGEALVVLLELSELV